MFSTIAGACASRRRPSALAISSDSTSRSAGHRLHRARAFTDRRSRLAMPSAPARHPAPARALLRSPECIALSPARKHAGGLAVTRSLNAVPAARPPSRSTRRDVDVADSSLLGQQVTALRGDRIQGLDERSWMPVPPVGLQAAEQRALVRAASASSRLRTGGGCSSWTTFSYSSSIGFAGVANDFATAVGEISPPQCRVLDPVVLRRTGDACLSASSW